MKIKLRVSHKNTKECRKELEDHGIEVTEDTIFFLGEENEKDFKLFGKNKEEDYTEICLEDIHLFECYDHDINAILMDKSYSIKYTLKELESKLPVEKFIRINKSEIVNIDKIEHITPLLGLRLKLTLTSKKTAYVTRSYFYFFKDMIGF